MNREELIYLIPYLLSLALSSGILIYAWRRQTVAGARPLAWLAATQAVWTFCFILELITRTLSGKLFWDAFQWVGGIFLPLIFPAFTIEYANFQIKRPRLVWGSLAAFPLSVLILVLTSGYHKLLYPNPHLVPGEPFSSLDYDFTALFWTYSLYVYAIIIGCMIVLIQKFGRSFPLYRSQVFIIAVGAAFPILVTFLPLIGINIAPQRDPTPFTFAIGNLIIGVGLFHYRLLDLVPIARERVLEELTDAIIVLDASNRVVDMNHAALANVGKTSPEVIGRPAQEVFAEWPELREQTQNLGNAVIEVSAMVKGEHKMYDLSVSSIRDQMNRLIGWVFVAHDITARKMLEDRYRLLSEEWEQRVLERTENLRVSESRLQALSRRLLEVQEAERRALTAELHDRIGQNLTALSINLQNTKALLSDEAAQVLATKFDDAQTLVEHTTRQIRDIMAELHPPELEDYGLAAALETYAERAASRGNLELIADLPDLSTPPLPSAVNIALFRVGQEAITNVLKHADATQLDVSLEERDGRIHLRVEDNGQGFEPDSASQKEEQTWGLKIMRERIESMGGKVQIESEPGEGTRVTFEIERPS